MSEQYAYFQHRESQFNQKKEQMNRKHIQNEKTQEDLINRLSAQQDHDYRRIVEENRRLRDQLDSQQIQIAELQR